MVILEQQHRQALVHLLQLVVRVVQVQPRPQQLQTLQAQVLVLPALALALQAQPHPQQVHLPRLQLRELATHIRF